MRGIRHGGSDISDRSTIPAPSAETPIASSVITAIASKGRVNFASKTLISIGNAAATPSPTSGSLAAAPVNANSPAR